MELSKQENKLTAKTALLKMAKEGPKAIETIGDFTRLLRPKINM